MCKVEIQVAEIHRRQGPGVITGQNLIKMHPSRVTPIIQCIELVDYLAAVGVGHTNAFLHNFFKSGFLGLQALHYYQKTAHIKSDA